MYIKQTIILNKIYNIYSNILKINNGYKNIIYNKLTKIMDIHYKNITGDLCNIKIKYIRYNEEIYYFDTTYYINNKYQKNKFLYNSELNIYYFYAINNDLFFINRKNTPKKSIEYNKNKNISYKYIYCNSYEIEYTDKNNKIINLNNNRTKNKKFNNKIWYLIKLIIITDKHSYDFILFKYYIFNNYYIYCLKCRTIKYRKYLKCYNINNLLILI